MLTMPGKPTIKGAGFIPVNLYATNQNGKCVEIKYVDIRGYWPDGKIGIDCYYRSNHATFRKVTLSDLEDIEGYDNCVHANKAIELYNKTFNL